MTVKAAASPYCVAASDFHVPISDVVPHSLLLLKVAVTQHLAPIVHVLEAPLEPGGLLLVSSESVRYFDAPTADE